MITVSLVMIMAFFQYTFGSHFEFTQISNLIAKMTFGDTTELETIYHRDCSDLHGPHNDYGHIFYIALATILDSLQSQI